MISAQDPIYSNDILEHLNHETTALMERVFIWAKHGHHRRDKVVSRFSMIEDKKMHCTPQQSHDGPLMMASGFFLYRKP